MRVERALGRTRGARGVDDHRRIVGRGVDRRRTVGPLGEQLPEGPLARRPAGDDLLQVRQAFTHRRDALATTLVGDDDLGPAVAEPVLERFWTEQHREWYRDRADLVGRHVGDRRLRALREDDRDAVARGDPDTAQRVAQAVGQAAQVAEGVAGDVTLVVLAEQRQRVGRVAVADVYTDVVARGYRPVEVGVKGVEVANGVVEHRHRWASLSRHRNTPRASG